ncbi:MAG: hypothetical protein ABII12_10935 [Planctomycetota bacterium]
MTKQCTNRNTRAGANEERSEYITLTQAAKATPGHVSSASVWRWARKGLRARNGEIIRLRHIRIGGRVYTKREWLEQFHEYVAEADLQNANWQHPNRNKEITELSPSHKQADAELTAAGL